jgi:peptide/nickel transport system permease protein
MGLRDYVIRRLIVIIPTFFLITLIIFSLIHLAPGDPIDIIYRGPHSGLLPAEKEILRVEWGLDQPIHIQYFSWLSKMLQGNLGFSYINQMSVSNVIIMKIPLTLELMLAAEIISIVVAIVLGVIAAVKHHSIYDAVSSVGALAGYSTPDFWLALMMMLLFSLWLKWFPSSGHQTVGIVFATPFEALFDHMKYLILPAVALVVGYTAYLFRMVRSAMLEVLTQDYIMTARSKGVKEWVVIYKHALRNALLPVITYVGYSVGFLLSGAAVIEEIFEWNGLGQLMVASTEVRDYPTLLGLSVFIAIMVLVANLCSDVAYAMIDPRIRYD